MKMEGLPDNIMETFGKGIKQEGNACVSDRAQVSVERCEQDMVKKEDVEIAEQFIVGNRVYDRAEFALKVEDIIDEENVSFSIVEENHSTNDVNSQQHRCDLCQFCSKRYCNLKRHVNSVHLNLKEHKCHLCDFASNYKDSLKMHINTVHLNLKKHKCTFCDFGANSKHLLKLHTDSVHLNSKRHECHLCDYATSYKGTLGRHIDAVHLNVKGHKCHLCEYASNQKFHLKRHMKSFH